MQLFHEIPDGQAIIRVSGNVLKQVKLYHRGERVYIPAGGGYVRIVAKFGDEWGTAMPKVKVIDMADDVRGLDISNEPRYRR